MVKIKGEKYYYSDQQRGIDFRIKSFVVNRCMPFVKGDSALDLGFVDGMWTDPLLDRGLRVDVVDGSAVHVDVARQKYAGQSLVRPIQAMFEEFEPDCQYDVIVAGDIIRYISKPDIFLRRMGSWLAPNGTLIVTVPNSLSLHRRIGFLMEKEVHPAALNGQDLEVGNLRSYDRYELRHALTTAGWSVKDLHGCFLKPLSSAQMSDWDDALLQAFYNMGDELEDYCWFLYAICSWNNETPSPLSADVPAERA